MAKGKAVAVRAEMEKLCEIPEEGLIQVYNSYEWRARVPDELFINSKYSMRFKQCSLLVVYVQ